MKIDEFYSRYWELINYRSEFILPKKVLNTWDDINTYNYTGEYEVLKKRFSEYQKPEILDVGAGGKKLKNIFDLMKIEYVYKSFDVSNIFEHDFHNIKEVTGKYDIITMLELIEHLSLEQFLEYLTTAFGLLKKNGTLIISTPNIDHINQLWKQDITHIQQYPAKDVYSILRMLGFSKEIDIYRINLRSKKMVSLKQYLIEKARIVLNKILGTDFAHGIMIIAKKYEQ